MPILLNSCRGWCTTKLSDMAAVPVTEENEPFLLKFMAVTASVTEPLSGFIVGVKSHVFSTVFSKVSETR